MTNKFYVTTPIYYVTARPHLGSLYSTLLADVVTRWQKLQGKETFFLTGSDEHGQKIAQAAAKAGKEPKPFVDSFIEPYKSCWAHYEIAYNLFMRTTEKYHVAAVQEWIRLLQKKGDIYKASYEGWYCVQCETFVTEKELSFKPGAQQGPACPTCNRSTQWLSEESYFFKLSAYQDKLLEFYKNNPNFIVPKERTAEVVNFVKEGLKDLSLSRTTITWGIPFPDDPKHTVYVWADALNNYITGIGWGQKGREQEFNKWWPADLHIMGKDIVRFHAIYWPAFLMAAGLELPKQLLVHGWIKMNDQKMSKSLGNVVDPEDLYKKYGAEPLRYYLLKQMAITQDGEFSIADLEQHITADLANDLGNLLNRLLVLAEKGDAQILQKIDTWSEHSLNLRDACWDMIEDVETLMEEYSFHMALARVWKFIGQVNAYFHQHEPWKLIKSDRKLFLEILNATCHSLHAIAIVLWPIMPQKMEQLLDCMGLKLEIHNDTIKNLELGNWHRSFLLKKGITLFEKPEPQAAALDGAVSLEKTVPPVQPIDNSIAIEDFTKIQLIVGTVEQCEEVPGSEKLFKLQVDFGQKGKRQVLSGVRQNFKAEELLGKQGVFVFNLKPRKMMGLESHGMMLFASDEQGNHKFVTVSGSVANGSPVK